MTPEQRLLLNCLVDDLRGQHLTPERIRDETIAFIARIRPDLSRAEIRQMYDSFYPMRAGARP